ncbi:MAG: FHA domain-containing protein [Kiritimatiellia bacterium]|nr:FHA domain-containing protein [Kiritimatiellia bacterium]
MAVLIGMSAEVKGKSFNLDRERVTIGRNATNLISIEHPTVSNNHGTLVREGNRYTLTDLGSTNGTRVNGQEIKECVLGPKDLVQFGSLEFLFDADDAEPGTVSPESSSQMRVEVSTGPATTPISFGSISPFGARRRENMTLWYVLIGVIGLLALALVALVIFKLFKG